MPAVPSGLGPDRMCSQAHGRELGMARLSARSRKQDAPGHGDLAAHWGYEDEVSDAIHLPEEWRLSVAGAGLNSRNQPVGKFHSRNHPITGCEIGLAGQSFDETACK